MKVKCGNWKCYREAKHVDVAALTRLLERDEHTDYDIARQGICGIHKGAASRRKYFKYDFGAIEDYPVVAEAYARSKAEEDARMAEDRKRREAESYENAKTWAKNDWAEVDVRFDVVHLSPKEWQPHIQEWVVYTEGDYNRPLYSVRVNDTQRYDDIPAPLEFQVLSHGGPASPSMALALAQALQQAAVFMAVENAKRRKD
jgi:hypothetical protein